jgi:hypothetical protein
MKKHLMIAAGLAVLSTSAAHATRARMDALGQDGATGSHFISDTRNVFKNPAHLNSMTNYVVTEWGANATATADPSSDAPQAEGGFFRQAGSFSYGVYLGSNVRAQNATKTHTTPTLTYLDRSNQLDLFFAGDAGVEWGFHIYRASNEDEQTTLFKQENDAMGIGLGVIFGDTNVYANIDFKEESKGSTLAVGDKWESETPMQIGVAHDWNSYTFFAEYNKTGYKLSHSTATTAVTDKNETKGLTLGAGHTKNVSSSARIYSSLVYSTSDNEDTQGTAAKTTTDATNLDLTFGFEVDANSWLTLRGNISQDLTGSSENTAKKKLSDERSTNVAAGATLNFGKLKVDGIIGTNSADTGIDNTHTESGHLDLDTLMTRVAVHYWF